MDLNDRLREGLDLKSLKGLEIGPLARPIVKKSDGDIIYVDHANTETLRAKYAGDTGVNVDDIVDVDHVWGAQTLQECIGIDTKVDYAIASHVVEHVPDLLTWLGELTAILKATGEIRLAVPDKRFSFDYSRNLTVLSDVIDAFLRKARSPLPRNLLDHFLNVRHVDTALAWERELPLDSIPRSASFEVAIWAANNALQGGDYIDAHCWVFTPKSFAALMRDAAEHDMIDLACSYFENTPRGTLEFVVCMKPSDDRHEIVDSWRRMEQSVSNDLPWSNPVQLHDSITLNAKLKNDLEEKHIEFGARVASLNDKFDAFKSSSANEIAALEEHVAVLRKDLERSETLNAALRKSTSWRLTSPIRFIGRMLKRQ
jgi:hypothetical protein